jgi:UDP-N-acetylmuramoyl-L-alanyl-D-glutamate--2,6-diaminopimelate ligase
MRILSDLAAAAGAELRGGDSVAVTGITLDSREVRGGELFVALPGTMADGAEFLEEALRNGAAAVCIEYSEAARLTRDSPLLLVPDTHAAAADLSAAFHDHPAAALRLIGITGTLGKTSTAALVSAALKSTAAGPGIGVIGSLGVELVGDDAATGPVIDLHGMTTPDAPALHRALRVLADAGVATVVMEVTSHALAQERVRGLRYALGVFTNLVPDEHLEFHGTAEDYLETKSRYFEHLLPGAPLVYQADDALLRSVINARGVDSGRELVGVGVQHAPDSAKATVVVRDERWHQRGSDFVLHFRGPLPRLDGREVQLDDLPLSLPLLGIQHVTNAALAATAALIAGATPDDVESAFARVSAVRRRMEIVRAADPFIIDDTTGNPESLRAVLQTVESIPRSGLRIAFGLRGSRGVEINALLASALGELVLERAREEPVHLVVTWCEEAAGERDTVTGSERQAVLDTLSRLLEAAPATLRYETEPTLSGAVELLLAGVRPDEVVLLLGTQGMDSASELARKALSSRSRSVKDA